MLDLVGHMRRKFLQLAIMAPDRVAKWDGDNLVVNRVLVDHPHETDRVTLHKRKRLQILAA